MSNKLCVGLQYCDATVADYDEIVKSAKCRCIKCFGAKSNVCDLCVKDILLGMTYQKAICIKCRFYNGK